MFVCSYIPFASLFLNPINTQSLCICAFLLFITRANVKEKVGKQHVVLKDLLAIFFSRDGPIAQAMMDELAI